MSSSSTKQAVSPSPAATPARSSCVAAAALRTSPTATARTSETGSSARDAARAGMSTFTIGGDREVHRLGYGAMRITGPGVWGPPPDHDAAIAVLRRTIELAIDLIDTADSYGPHVSERLIAEALHPYPHDPTLATKGGLERTGPGQWPRNGHPEHLKAACEGSLKDLRVDRIDL